MSVIPYSQLPNTIEQCVTRIFTADELKNWHATPLKVLNAPGAGYANIPMLTKSIFTPGDTPYDVSGVNNPTLFYANEHDGIVDQLFVYGKYPFIPSLLTADVKKWTVVPGFSINEIGNEEVSNFENRPLYIWSDAGEFTLGNGTLKMIIHFYKAAV
jgi:hypothetical protein